MPTIKEIRNIFEVTPCNQAIMLNGEHGKGKSEFAVDFWTQKGYRVICLFLGQMADAGDVIGLPDRTEIEIEGKKIKVTEFCPPKWMPFNAEEKVVVLLDEANRGKSEINQCIMDMVLNRKLNGYTLPEHTRIVACINPSGDDYDYDVNAMGPAFLDRFNMYMFEPSVDEWVDWATDKKVNKYIIGFISGNKQYLDPPDAKTMKQDTVYPSRRSWVRVSDIINNTTSLVNAEKTLATLMLGVVGVDATSKFVHYLREQAKNLNAGMIITQWDDKMKEKLKDLPLQEYIHINKQITMWFKEQYDVMKAGSSKDAAQYTYNVEKYLGCTPLEAQGEFFSLFSEAREKDEKWPLYITELNPNIADAFIEVYNKVDKNKK